MSPSQAFILVSAIVLFAGYAILVAIDLFKQWRKRRDERRAIDEHTDEFWRQVG